MMKKSTRMQKITDINRSFESVAGIAHSRAQMALEQQTRQLEQLKLYRDEYKDRLRERFSSGISRNEINDYRFFFRSLEDAIKAQENVVHELDGKKESSRDEWLAKKNATKKIEKVTDRLRKSEDHKANVQENRENDELSQVLFNFHHSRESY